MNHETTDVLRIDDLYMLCTRSWRYMRAARLYARKPGLQVHSIVAISVDGTGANNREPLSKDAAQPPLAFRFPVTVIGSVGTVELAHGRAFRQARLLETLVHST